MPPDADRPEGAPDHAHGPRRGRGAYSGPVIGRRRLRREAFQPPRVGCAGRRGPAARGRIVRRWGSAGALVRRIADRPEHARGPGARRAGDADGQGVRPSIPAGLEPWQGLHARPAHGVGVGIYLLRRHEHRHRARAAAAREGGARPGNTPLPADRMGRRLQVRRMKRAIRTAGAALLFLAASLVLALFAASLFGVPAADLPAVAILLAVAGGGSGLLALILVRPTVLGRLGGVRAQLVGAGLVLSLLLLGMLLAGARAMFISGHDLALLLTMLTFAAVLSVGFGLLYAMPLSSRIERVRAGTERIAGGELGSEVKVEGHDEVAGLAADFNRMARALEVAAEREREVEKSRRDLVAAVSHDLRTPLASTRALIEALADGVAENPETQRRYLTSASRELEHLSRLVDDLFELARIEAGLLELTLEEASLHDMISDTISSFQPQAEQKGIRLLGEVSGNVDPVLANPPKLQRVLHNLVSNALRHTPQDGAVTLRAAPEGDVTRVEVSDTGEGIASEDLPRVFERSFRGEQSRTRPNEDGAPGAGLGLAIARGLVEAHGGTMNVQSEPGQGSLFRFTLKRA